MAKLSLKANPTFKAKVGIPIPGGDPVEVEFTFKHRTREQFAEFLKSLDGKQKEQAVLDIACAWELEDAFNEASVNELLSNYIGAFDPILEKYMDELTKAREKN